MQGTYLESIQLIERLHRQFLEVVKAELDKLHVEDINNIQALILFNIGNDQLTVGELTYRGYYLGSNVSYNVKKMAENGYLLQEPSPHDKRSIRIKLSDKGLALCEKIGQMFTTHAGDLEKTDISQDKLKDANGMFRMLEKFWTETLNRAGVSPFDL